MGTRSGKEYLFGIRDGREVWLRGERVEDVVADPVLGPSAASIARLYDMQCDSEWEQILSYRSDNGEKNPMSFLPPRTHEDLRRRRRAYSTSANATFGLMGRSPDFLNSGLTAFAMAAEFFGQADRRFSENITNYWRHCRDNDIFLAHATINPQVSRSKSSSEQDDPFVHLRIARETDAGLVVRGAKMIGTLVPIADELLVFPLPRYTPGDEAYTATFAIPMDTPGLRLVCREPFGTGVRGSFDHPLSRFDEMDATCIFDDVLVPWDRVFFYGDVDLANSLYDATTARHHTGHQSIVRGLAKAELMAGVAVTLAKSAGTDAFLHVQEYLGEIIGMLELVRGAVLLAEEEASTSRWGTITPSISAIQAVRYHFPRMCSRMIEVIQILGGGSLLSTPTEADLGNSLPHGVLRFFPESAGGSAKERIHLLKLAWDITGDGFGQRQMQFERYHAGDPVRLAAQQYTTYDKTALLESVERVLDRPRAAL